MGATLTKVMFTMCRSPLDNHSSLSAHAGSIFIPANATLFRLTLLLALLSGPAGITQEPSPSRPTPGAEPAVSLTTELQRLRTTDHLYLPQSHRLHQYSGFSRSGSNPDRLDFLYREGDWLVYADVEGPGVVSRIWATHGDAWQDIRIELDGRVIYEGDAGGFFRMNRPPFVAPLCEERSVTVAQRTAEGETGKIHRWGVSYVPLPFQSRFRYLQKKQLYTNVNVKRFDRGTPVAPFPATLAAGELAEVGRTAAAWKSMNPLPESPARTTVVDHELKLPAATNGKPAPTSSAVWLTGPGIIREIRIHTAGLDRATLEALTLHLRWDGSASDAIAVPLDVGLGSLQQRTLALGRSDDGWQFMRLPMPFRRGASIRIVSRAVGPLTVRLQVVHEKAPDLPANAMYLHGHGNAGKFTSGQDQFAHPEVPAAEFLYHNGYTALDTRGSGHVVAYLDRFDCQPELDEHVFIDGERTFPDNTWNGTGHEDLFDMAWGHKPTTTPMTSGGSEKFEEVNVKLFWNDPLTFRTALRFNWEWSYKLGVPPPRDAVFRSVVYWYAPAPQAERTPATTR